MKYQIIHVEIENYPTRLWRDIAISGNPNLMELAVIIGSSLQVEFSEQFFITDSNWTYASSLGKNLINQEDTRLFNTAHLGDLDSGFYFLYDLHDNWLFKCTKKEEKLNKTNMPFAFVIDGHGQGLFECNKESFDAYMKGDIKPSDNDDSFLDDYDHDYELPFNMNFTCFGDFEKPLNLDNMKFSKQEIKQTIKYIEDREETIFDTDDELWDDDFENDDPFSFLNTDDLTEEDIDHALHLTRALIAYDIFENDDVNKVFRRLIKKYDMNEAFDMITKATLEVMLDCDDPEGEEFLAQRLHALQKLK